MRIEDYDNSDNDPDNDEYDVSLYRAFVEWLSQQTVAELRRVKQDTEAQKQALCRYYKRGDHANFSHGELIDFLCVSTPSIVEDAGYNEQEADALIQISSTLTEEEVGRADISGDREHFPGQQVLFAD